MKTNLDQLNQTFTVKEPLRVGGGNGPSGRFHGTLDEVQLFQRCLSARSYSFLQHGEPKVKS
jgi:hypothetical protein